MVISMVSTVLFFKLYSPQPHAVDFIISLSYFQLLVQCIKSFLLAFVMPFDPAFLHYVLHSLVFCLIRVSSSITFSPGGHIME